MAILSEWGWWRRLQAWWQEYYVDNPAVWLLASPRSSIVSTPSGRLSQGAASHVLTTGSPLSVPPIWQWYALPLWWISLVPPILPYTLLLVHHPLWGFPQIAITLLIALGLVPQAVRWVEQARLRHEPELTPDEGDYW